MKNITIVQKGTFLSGSHRSVSKVKGVWHQRKRCNVKRNGFLLGVFFPNQRKTFQKKGTWIKID